MMKKTAIAVVIGMIINAVPLGAVAQDATVTNVACQEVVPSFEEAELEDNDALFEGYVQKRMYFDNSISMFSGNYAESVLDEVNYAIYSKLKEQITIIAAEGGSAIVAVPDECYESADLTVETANEAEIASAIRSKFLEYIYTSDIQDCLLIDCPYELYWFDKTKGMSCAYSYSYYQQGGVYHVSLTNLTFRFQVAEGYRGATDTSETPCVTADVSAVATAIEQAKQVVAEHQDKTDREKLYAYKAYLCNAVDYNYDAAMGGVAYGDPWQLIHVFDNDASTKVVCEGYSKAFQYLCELSEFYDDDFASYLVTGLMEGGGHMWNVVTLGGVNYLVDVTNSDAGSVGQGGGLFMALNPEGGTAEGYTVVIDSYNQVTYQYDSEEMDLYGEEILALGTEVTYALMLADDGNGTVTTEADKYLYAGDEVVLTAKPKVGYEFAGYLVNGELVQPIDGTIIMPDKDTVVKALFAKTTAEQILGDADGNGVVDEDDIRILRMHFVDEYEIADFRVIDFFGTGEVTSKNLVRLRKYLNHDITEL